MTKQHALKFGRSIPEPGFGYYNLATEQALSDRPAIIADTTNVIHVLKLLACHNSG